MAAIAVILAASICAQAQTNRMVNPSRSAQRITNNATNRAVNNTNRAVNKAMTPPTQQQSSSRKQQSQSRQQQSQSGQQQQQQQSNSASVQSGGIYYVSATTGNNQNDGSMVSPFKNIQKAIDVAADGSVIYVAEGNYYGLLNKGNINVTKPVEIYGGYSPDFSIRDMFEHPTLIQPPYSAMGTASGQGTMNIQVKKPNTEVVIDGLIFDRGNTIAYSTKGEGRPEGVESAMAMPITVAGSAGEKFEIAEAKTVQTSTLYLENISCDLTVQNCLFVNSPFYGIIGTVQGTEVEINNCVFINNRFAAVEINGGTPTKFAEIYFSNNTVLFSWSRTKDYGDMGYGFRYGTRTNGYVTNNIIGLSIFGGLDRARLDADKAREAQRVCTAENNIFFLNKQGDLNLPGSGKFMRIDVEDFGDVSQLNAVSGNKALTDPATFKGIINEPYLNGFLNASYSETTSVDRNSPANVFRSALGMNIQGMMQSSATMYFNRYPWREALEFFGAMPGYGAQDIE